MELSLPEGLTEELADLLDGTDDDLWIGLQQVGYYEEMFIERAEPYQVSQLEDRLRRMLAKTVNLRQCCECGEWFRGKRHGCSRS